MKQLLKKAGRIILTIVFWFIILSVATVIIYRWVPPPVTPLMIKRVLEQRAEGKPATIKKDWVPLEEISAALPLAVMTAEDQKFELHFGFDLDAIEKAQQYNERHKGKKIKGASTITQQTAKNVFLWPARSWFRKAFEVYFTFLIEIFWSKHRIMEVYLNVIEMGPGIYGAEQASRYYFHKPAYKLNRSESALIAAILPNPVKWSAAKPTLYINRKKNWILQRMNKLETDTFRKN